MQNIPSAVTDMYSKIYKPDYKPRSRYKAPIFTGTLNKQEADKLACIFSVKLEDIRQLAGKDQ